MITNRLSFILISKTDLCAYWQLNLVSHQIFSQSTPIHGAVTCPLMILKEKLVLNFVHETL